MNSLRWLILGLLLGGRAWAESTPAPLPKEESGTQWNFNLLPKSFQSHPALDISVITEMTEEGKKRSIPTGEKPAYVIYQSGGIHNEGHAPVGKSLTPEELQQVLERTFAAQHYLPSVKEHPPTLVIIYHWGSFSNLDPGDADHPGFDDVGHKNLLNRAALVGGVKFSKELAEVMVQQDEADRAAADYARSQSHMAMVGITMPAMPSFNPLAAYSMRSPKIEELVQRSIDDCYYLVASAYDYATLAREKKQKLLWRTKITASTDGVGLAETLPVLITTAGAYYGREMSEASLLTRKIDRKGKVEIGPATVKDYYETEKPTTDGEKK
jgi:hypothetical protein